MSEYTVTVCDLCIPRGTLPTKTQLDVLPYCMVFGPFEIAEMFEYAHLGEGVHICPVCQEQIRAAESGGGE